jgi:hypothetical protein
MIDFPIILPVAKGSLKIDKKAMTADNSWLQDKTDMPTRQHNERCKECKKRILELLRYIYSDAIERHNLNLPANLEGYTNTELSVFLKKIHTELQEYRGFIHFTRAKKLSAVDYYVSNPSFIVEFDESQHFTKPREITLQNYPSTLKLGFDKYKWIERCIELDCKDNDPPYRDEQRAWYDTLRDFSSVILKIPLIRILPNEHVWCTLNVDNATDVQWFKNFIENRLRMWSKDNP